MLIHADVEVRKVGYHPGYLPEYSYVGDAGADLCAAEEVTLKPGERALVPTGVVVGIPQGFAGFVHPRSGLAYRHGVTVLNAPGTIDAAYRGEVGIILINTDPDEAFTIKPGDRIAQLVVQPVIAANFIEVDYFGRTDRGEGGFGSTGR